MIYALAILSFIVACVVVVRARPSDPLPESTVILARTLRAIGYRDALIAKWLGISTRALRASLRGRYGR